MRQKRIIKIRDLICKVKSDVEDRYYLVDLDMNWCECKGFFYTKKECKHIKMAREFMCRQKEI